MSSSSTQSVYRRDGAYFLPTGLSRGPWDERAQHGGAPAALLAHLAQEAAGEDFVLARLTFELTRPIPIAPLTVVAEASRGKTARRVQLTLEHATYRSAARSRSCCASSWSRCPITPGVF